MARILIVEDEPDIAMVLERDLKVEGYDTGLARDGEEALRRANAARIVVVPAAEHLAHLPGLQHADPSAVERHVGARVLAVHPCDGSRTSSRRRRRWGRSARRSS